ncbi:SPOR domain-containing protein [Paenibacillus sp. BAC0078]
MSNGRMTFRFDVDREKSRPEPLERRSTAGLGTAKEYAEIELRREAELRRRSIDTDSEAEQAGHLVELGEYDLIDLRRQERGEGFRELDDTRQSFFRSGHAPDLWEREPRYPLVPQGDPEDEYGERYRSGEWKTEAESFGDIPLSGGGYSGSYHTRRPSYWWKLALAITGALGTGVLLGYAALSFIGGGSLAGGGGNTKVDSAVVQNGTTAADGQTLAGNTDSGPSGTAKDGVSRIPVQVAAQSYYLLQYGVFSTPAGAEQARQDLLDTGLAAALDPADGNRVYAGMSPDREQAKLLSSGLKNQGIELYVRGVTLPAVEQAAYAGKAEPVNSYFAASGKLLNEMSGLSASLLSGQGQAADSSAVSDLHMQWTEAVKTLEPGLPAEARNLCAELEKSMSQGISALNEYKKNKAQGHLWEVQEAMMSFLTGQKRLLSLLAE